MPKNLRTILGIGGGRVSKQRTPGRDRGPAGSPSASVSRRSPAPKRPRPGPAARAGEEKKDGDEAEEEERPVEVLEVPDDYFAGHLVSQQPRRRQAPPVGDVARTLGESRAAMFSPPAAGRGLGSRRLTDVLARQAAVPPLATVARLRALLASPTAAERELAALARAGAARRIAVTRRGEIVILREDLERILAGRGGVGDAARAALTAWLAENPGRASVARGQMAEAEADELVRAGLLVRRGAMVVTGGSGGGAERLRLRPGERGTLISLDRISKAASGTVEAAGGAMAVHLAGGGGYGGGGGAGAGIRQRNARAADTCAVTREDLDLAVPGQGAFMRLATGGVEHVVSLLQNRTRFGVAPESILREWWDCAGGLEAPTATQPGGGGRGRRRVWPGRTVKWRDLDGLRFEWALEEAVGSGAVEVFDAGPAGPAVRLV